MLQNNAQLHWSVDIIRGFHKGNRNILFTSNMSSSLNMITTARRKHSRIDSPINFFSHHCKLVHDITGRLAETKLLLDWHDLRLAIRETTPQRLGDKPAVEVGWFDGFVNEDNAANSLRQAKIVEKARVHLDEVGQRRLYYLYAAQA